MKLLCDHAVECGQRCKHAVAHESYGKQCEDSWLCVHVRAGERTVCKPLDKVVCGLVDEPHQRVADCENPQPVQPKAEEMCKHPCHQINHAGFHYAEVSGQWEYCAMCGEPLARKEEP